MRVKLMGKAHGWSAAGKGINASVQRGTGMDVFLQRQALPLRGAFPLPAKAVQQSVEPARM